MRRSLSLALAAALAVTALPASVSSAVTTAAPTPGALRWGPCPGKAPASRLECSTLDVHGRPLKRLRRWQPPCRSLFHVLPPAA